MSATGWRTALSWTRARAACRPGVACGGMVLAALISSATLAEEPRLADRSSAPPTPSTAPASDEFVSEADWRALSTGKTLTYSTPYGVMGREYYEPNSNRVVFVYFDGRCFEGTWSYQDGIYCFEYDGLHCFEHLRRGEDLIARELDGDEQVVTDINDDVLSCSLDMLSENDWLRRLGLRDRVPSRVPG